MYIKYIEKERSTDQSLALNPINPILKGFELMISQTAPSLLSCPKAIAPSAVTYRYFWKEDSEGCPEDVIQLDVVTTVEGRKGIQQLVSATSWLEGYYLHSFWTPNDNCPF